MYHKKWSIFKLVTIFASLPLSSKKWVVIMEGWNKKKKKGIYIVLSIDLDCREELGTL